MSTEYPLLKSEGYELSLVESSSTFEVFLTDHATEEAYAVTKKLSAEEVVDAAMKLIQPTLYNVEDPEKFMKGVIEKKLGELFV